MCFGVYLKLSTKVGRLGKVQQFIIILDLHVRVEARRLVLGCGLEEAHD
jgi:hypothetical protein